MSETEVLGYYHQLLKFSVNENLNELLCLFQKAQQTGTQNDSNGVNFNAVSPIIEQIPQIIWHLESETRQVRYYNLCLFFFNFLQL